MRREIRPVSSPRRSFVLACRETERERDPNFSLMTVDTHIKWQTIIYISHVVVACSQTFSQLNVYLGRCMYIDYICIWTFCIIWGRQYEMRLYVSYR